MKIKIITIKLPTPIKQFGLEIICSVRIMVIILVPVAVTTTEKTELIIIPTATKVILRTTIINTSEMVDVRKVKIKNKNLFFFLLFLDTFLNFCSHDKKKKEIS